MGLDIIMLVFLTVLEFICAQAPFRLKGFMAGIWYAMLSVKFFITTIDIVIAYYHLMDRMWIIHESIKIGMIGLSLIVIIVLSITCRWYKYRELDEVVKVIVSGVFEFTINFYDELLLTISLLIQNG